MLLRLSANNAVSKRKLSNAENQLKKRAREEIIEQRIKLKGHI